MTTYVDLGLSSARFDRSIGGDSLTLKQGDGLLFGSPTAEAPMRLVVYRGDVFKTILKATGRSDDVLAIDGTYDGYEDVGIQVGDKIANVPTAGDFNDLQYAINTISLTPGPQGIQGETGPQGDTGADGPQGEIGPAGVGSFGLTMPDGFTVSNSPLTDSGTIVVSTTLSGLLKGDGTAFTTAVAGTDYVSPSGLTSALASKADDSAVIHIAGSETVTGVKTLRTPVVIGNSTADILTISNSAGTTVGSFDQDGYAFIEKATFLLALGQDLAVGTNLTGLGVIASNSGKIVKCKAQALTNGASGGFSFTIRQNGSPIFASAQSVAASTTTVQSFNSFSSTSIAEGDVFTIDCNTTGAGVQLVGVTLYYLPREERLMATARILGRDTVSQGTWIGRLASQGYWMYSAGTIAQSLPSYVTSVTRTGLGTAALNTTDPRGLQSPSGLVRSLGAIQTTGVQVGIVNVNDSAPHRFSVYLVSVNATDTATFTMTDTSGNALDTPISLNSTELYNGTWIHVVHTGSVQFRVTYAVNPSRFSGVVFDPYVSNIVGGVPAKNPGNYIE